MNEPDETEPKRWRADAYDRDHSFVSEYGQDVLQLLEPSPGERILDLGCGTGHLPTGSPVRVPKS